MSFDYKEEYGYFTSACLNVTDACNLACKYCFVQQQPHFMDLGTAKKCVDFLAENIKKSGKEKGILTFFGGEPTLLWDEVIVPLVYYVEENYKNLIEFTITTNGTLLDRERIDFMYEHQIFPHLSCDGDEFVQNTNRPTRSGESSFNLVNKNIPYLLYRFPNTTMRATISQDTVEEVFNSYLFAIKKGFNFFFATPNCREDWTEENIDKLNKQVQLIYSYNLASFIDEKEPINFSLIDDTFRHIRERDLQVINNIYNNISVIRSPFRCGLGTTTASFAYDGKIYACQEQNSYGAGDFYIGDIYVGINKECHSQLLQKYMTESIQYCIDKNECRNCPLRHTCQDDCCPSVGIDLYNDFFCHNIIECRWKKMLFYNALPMMEVLVKQKNETFKKYLNNRCNYKEAD